MLQSNWEIPIVEYKGLVARDSTHFYDNIEEPIHTSNDRKNMEVREESLTKEVP